MSNVPLPKVDYDAGWHRQYTSDQMHAHAAAVSAAKDAEIERLRARVRVLECALRFYANPGDYKAPFTGGMGALYFDCGSIARAALEQAP